MVAAALGLLAAPAAQAQTAEFDVGPTAVPATAVETAEVGPDGPLASSGPPIDGPVLPPAAAEEVLDEAEAAVAGEPGTPDPTLALNQLSRVMPALSGAQRQRGETLMARPTQRRKDPLGDGYNRPAFAIASRHFCVFFVKRGRDAIPLADGDSNGFPDYAETMLAVAEFSYKREHGSLGWRRPRSDGRRGCKTTPNRSRIDIYAVDLPQIFGYAATDPRQRSIRQYAYLVIDNDMREFPGYSNPVVPLAVTAAHEYNHVIQYSYSVIQDDWMLESSAVATEDYVFPNLNDYLQYISDVANRVAIPLTTFGNDLKPYGDAVWNFFLMRRYGVRVLPNSWAASLKTRPQSFAPLAYDRGIRGATGGRSDFIKEFVKFAASLPEWRGSSLYPDSNRYPRVRRSGGLRIGGGKRMVLDHTTYRLLTVRAGGRVVRFHVGVRRGVSSGLALVGRLPDGRLVKSVRVLKNGGRGTVRLTRPGRFQRITAVVANADFDQRGFSERTRDWRYTGNNVPYALRLTR